MLSLLKKRVCNLSCFLSISQVNAHIYLRNVLGSGFVFNASAFIFYSFLLAMPITWSGSLFSSQRHCMMQCSDKNPLFLWRNCLQVRYMNASFSVRGIKKWIFFFLEKKMSSNWGHSSQSKLTLKRSFKCSI